METKKLPRAHVWNHKKWLGRRTIIPFAFRGRYDPNDACEIKLDVMKPSPNFFQAGWSHPIHHSEPLILSQIGWYSMKNGVTPKNHLGRAFATIKNDWYVVRPSKLLHWIAMIICMSAKTNFIIGRPLENFLDQLKNHFALHWHPLFEAFSMKTAHMGYENQKITLGSRLER